MWVLVWVLSCSDGAVLRLIVAEAATEAVAGVEAGAV